MANSYPTAPTNTASIAAVDGAASGSFSLIGQYDLGVAPPHELLIDVLLKPSTAPGGAGFQSVIYITSSIDGTNWSEAPTSTTDQNARMIGRIHHPDATARRAVAMAVSPQFAGALARYIRVYVKNDLGVTYAGSGNNSIAASAELFG